MQFVELMSIFIGFARGLTPAKVSEPIDMLSSELMKQAESLDSKVYALDYSNREKEILIESLKGRIEFMTSKLQGLSLDPSNNTIVTILHRLVAEEIILPDHPILKHEIMGYYKETNNKIHTIKLLRQITGMGLAASKRQVDTWISNS